MKRRIFLGLLLCPRSAWAHSFQLGAIAIGHAWGLPTDRLETSVMMPMLNTGATADALISVTSPAAQSVELRDAGRIVSEFPLVPNHPFPMRATSKHLQVIGLLKPMIAGEKLQLILNFRNAGQIQIDVYIAEKAGE